MTIAYIGLGSNLSDPKKQIIQALSQLDSIESSKTLACSSLYFSRPMGPQDQPDYMNAVAAIETSLSAIQLLDCLQAIEQKAGRVRKGDRWGARILDLDIIMFGNELINNERLTIPHYGMLEREFVIIPLAEIAPQLALSNGKSAQEMADIIERNGLKVHSKLR